MIAEKGEEDSNGNSSHIYLRVGGSVHSGKKREKPRAFSVTTEGSLRIYEWGLQGEWNGGISSFLNYKQRRRHSFRNQKSGIDKNALKN